MSKYVGLEYHQENENPPAGRKKNSKQINYLKPWISCQVDQAAQRNNDYLESKNGTISLATFNNRIKEAANFSIKYLKRIWCSFNFCTLE